MANLEQMSKVLSKTTNDLNAYTKVFNNAAQSVIGDTEAMGRSAVDLREQLNKLLSDAQGLSNLGKNIKFNGREDYIKLINFYLQEDTSTKAFCRKYKLDNQQTKRKLYKYN